MPLGLRRADPPWRWAYNVPRFASEHSMPPPARSARPPRARTIAFGDIHGCLAPLNALLEHLQPTPADHLIFLGDYIDRGPDSAGVIERLIGLKKQLHVSCIMGNHEEMMLGARSEQDTLLDWLRNGGRAALASYAVPPEAYARLRDVPAEHWDFLETQLVPYVETATHLFVHASADPESPMAHQSEHTLRWERFEAVTRPHFSGKILVCGHTPQPEGRPAHKGFAICLDTHAFRGGPLTCLDVIAGRIHQATPEGEISDAPLSDFEE
jgi:serine/threonine protein phosphatase 1